MTVHAVRTIEGAWNVIIDQDAASDGSQDGITLNTVGARELARLLLNAADSESAEDGPAYVNRLEEAKLWYTREMNFALDRRPEGGGRDRRHPRRPRRRPGDSRAI